MLPAKIITKVAAKKLASSSSKVNKADIIKYGSIGLGLTALSVLTFVGIKKITQNNSAKAQVREELNDREKEIDHIKVDKGGLSISDSEAELISQTLLQAMANYGTDEKTIKRNLEPLNHDDLLLVIKKFGIKPYASGVLATTWLDKKYLSRDINLIGWLKAELEGQDLKDVENKFLMEGVIF